MSLLPSSNNFGRGFGELARQTQREVQRISSIYTVAQIKVDEASALYRRAESDLFSASNQTAQDIRALPDFAAVIQPLIREYGATLNDIQRRAARG